MWRQVVLAAAFLAPPAALGQSQVIAPPPDVARPGQFSFSPADEKLLEEIQHACFLYFWREVGDPACLAKDRMKGPVASIAAVGFQLSSLPIGVQRGWVTREKARERAEVVLRSLLTRRDNRREGVYLHFPDLNTAGPSHHGYETVASTVDTALLLAGAVVAAEYFGGQVSEYVDQMLEEANWRWYAVEKDNGFISMGWRAADVEQMDGPGEFLKWHWWTASDEERLIYFLAVGSPRSEHAVDPALYYKLQRTVKSHADLPGFVVSWPGTLFTYFFSHCWIDYAALGTDDPSRFGASGPRVDWWENSRRAVLSHRQRCRELGERYKTLSGDIWGLSACASRDGYIVPEIRPNLRDEEQLFEGTVAPYAAGSAIMFTPAESLAALRAMRALKGADGKPLVWRDPSEGGYGFVDSFNLDQNYAHDDYVGIDQGPMLLAIENARTGLIWKLFMRHPNSRRAVERLRLGSARSK